jgi:hypothetical protein
MVMKATCSECGWVFFIMEPGSVYDQLKQRAPELVVDTESEDGYCPHCGAPILLPPAEMLEPGRTIFGRWLEKAHKQMDEADEDTTAKEPK